MMEWPGIGGTLACLAALGLGACSDDGRVIGERSSSGGASGQAGSVTGPTGGSSGDGSGGMASNAGTANAGTENAGTAGEATGGDAGGGAGGGGASATGGGGGTAGDAGNGGAGGSAGSGGGSAGMSGSSGMNCVDRNCTSSEACVAHRTVGGAITFPDDAGACPLYAHRESSYCQANFSYQCVAQPRCTGGVVDCTCGTCPQGSPTCRAPYVAEWLDPSAKLVCELLAP